jgi:hypothetical protein
MNIPSKGQSYLKQSVLLLNKMFQENRVLRVLLQEDISNGDLKQFEEVMKLVVFDDSRKLPCNVVAETDREIGPNINYTVYINPRFKEQFKTHNTALENHRLRFVNYLA